MSQETTPGLYNAPMHVATKLNRELIARYAREDRIDELVSLFEVQFDALRRAEALQMLHIHEIRTLRHQLAGRDDPASSHNEFDSPASLSKSKRQERAITNTGRSQPATPKPAKRNIEAEIEL